MKTEAGAVALDHAWKWFEYHANQRISLLKFFLLTAGAVATAYAAAYQAGVYELSLGAAIFGIIVSVCFFRLDQRVGQLIKLGEAVINQEEDRIRDLVEYEEILIIKASEKKGAGRLQSYRQILRFLFVSALLIYGLGVVWALPPLVCKLTF